MNRCGKTRECEAAKKQIPMPLRIKAHESINFKYLFINGNRVFNIDYEAYCQNCNELVSFGNRSTDLYIHTKEYKQYCPHCGQKLWWSNN